MSTTLHPATRSAPSPDGPVGHGNTQVEISERPVWVTSGWVGVGAMVVLLGLAAWLALRLVTGGYLDDQGSPVAGAPVVATVLALVVLVLAVTAIGTGLSAIQPGKTRVVEFFGRYLGTVRRTGLVLTVPFTMRRAVSVRVHNFETAHLKVNDADGNPVDVAAIVVWQVADTAKSVYAVEEYEQFNQVQAEAALRHVAGAHPYDDTSGVGTSLRGSTELVAHELASEVADRVKVAGVEIVECRISHLAYSKEIAGAMLQRQQANAVVAARERIVEGAVGMVEMALERLSERDIVDLDDERRAAMVSNLLVVLCGDSRATPVVNTGTLYN